MACAVGFLNEQALICDPDLRVHDRDFEPLQFALITAGTAAPTAATMPCLNGATPRR
jgi:hypothetical protein